LNRRSRRERREAVSRKRTQRTQRNRPARCSQPDVSKRSRVMMPIRFVWPELKPYKAHSVVYVKLNYVATVVESLITVRRPAAHQKWTWLSKERLRRFCALETGCSTAYGGGMSSEAIIHSDPEVLGGTPVFIGTRVPAQSLFDHLEGGDSIDDFLEGFPSVKREQVIALLDASRQTLA